MTDSLTIWGTDYTGVKGFKANDGNDNTLAYVRPQGTKSITENGTGIDVAEYATVDVSVSGGGTPTLQTKTKNYTPTEVDVNVSGGGSSKNIQVYAGYDTRKANSYGATNVKLTVAKTGTYTITWIAWRSSSSGTMGTNLHIGSTAEATNHQTFTGTYGQCITLTGQSLTQGTVITVYATSGSTSRSIYVGNLIIEEE